MVETSGSWFQRPFGRRRLSDTRQRRKARALSFRPESSPLRVAAWRSRPPDVAHGVTTTPVEYKWNRRERAIDVQIVHSRASLLISRIEQRSAVHMQQVDNDLGRRLAGELRHNTIEQ